MVDKNKKDAAKGSEEIDYLHPDGAPTLPPRTKEEKKNEKQAEESTKLAEELKPDK